MSLVAIVAVAGLILYLIMVSVSLLGYYEISTRFNAKARSEIDTLVVSAELPGVTILRPLKGVDPDMERCLRSTFEQDYPSDKLEIIMCVQDERDPALAVAKRIIEEYPGVDAKVLVDEADSLPYYGPNPKINNLAKGYKAAAYDTLWVIDANVWARPDTLQRSVVSLVQGLHDGRPVERSIRKMLGLMCDVKMVLHTPLAAALDKSDGSDGSISGSMLDEMFLSTSHAKFYTALNTLQIAPCVNGKSNLYRRSDLDAAVALYGEQSSAPSADGMSGDVTRDARYYGARPGEAIRLFARYIGEDNMIGIALWDYGHGRAVMCGDAVVQPLVGGSIRDYVDRRVRWLRVRKFMVLAATLIEPTTESIVSGLIGSFSLSTLFWGKHFSWAWFILHMSIWFYIDYRQVPKLGRCMREPPVPARDSPAFLADCPSTLGGFLKVWVLRELLAFPIWVMAMAGEEIDWRGQPFRIKPDLTAERL